jgi:phosphotransferase system HPr-like phosphotransfer protein
MARSRKHDGRYNANLTKASLKISETRILARALVDHPSSSDWKSAILTENVLQKRNPVTAKTLAAVIIQRLECLNRSMLEVVAHGQDQDAAVCVLVATLKQSTLLADFFEVILIDLYRSFAQVIPPTSWDKFMEGCLARDPSVARWTPVVVRKLRQNVLRILAESGYIEDTRSLKLVRVQIPSSIESMLLASGEQAVLGLLKVGEA